MIWTLLSVLLVLGIRLFSVYRLRGLKKQLSKNTPRLEKLHIELAKRQAEVKSAKAEEALLQGRLNHLKDVVHTMEANLKKPAKTDAQSERAAILEAENAL